MSEPACCFEVPAGATTEGRAGRECGASGDAACSRVLGGKGLAAVPRPRRGWEPLGARVGGARGPRDCSFVPPCTRLRRGGAICSFAFAGLESQSWFMMWK